MPVANRTCGTCAWRINATCGAYSPKERQGGNIIVNTTSSCRHWLADLTTAKCELCVYWAEGRCHKLVALISESSADFWCGEFVPKKV